MPIIKHVDKEYVTIPNQTAQNKELSILALGALTRLASYSENYEFKVEWLQKNWGVGRDKVRDILRELKGQGYLEHRPIHRDGKFAGQEWWIAVTPTFFGGYEDWLEPEGPEPQSPGNPVVLEPSSTGNTEYIKKEETLKKEESKKKESSLPPISPTEDAFEVPVAEAKVALPPPKFGSPKTVKSVPSKARKVETEIPDDFEPTQAMLDWAAEKYPEVDVDRETTAFKLHAEANGRRQKDWNASWRLWMTKARPAFRGFSAPLSRKPKLDKNGLPDDPEELRRMLIDPVTGETNYLVHQKLYPRKDWDLAVFDFVIDTRKERGEDDWRPTKAVYEAFKQRYTDRWTEKGHPPPASEFAAYERSGDYKKFVIQEGDHDHSQASG